MNIGFNPHAATHAQKAHSPRTQTMPHAPKCSGDAVEITLSKAAKSILRSGGPGKSGNSPAHKAAHALADGKFRHDGQFGQHVKMFAQGYEVPIVVEDSDPAIETSDTGTKDGDHTIVTEGTGGTGDTGTTEGDGTIVTEGTGTTGDTGTTEGGDTTVTEGTGGTGDTGDTRATEGDGTIVTEGTGTTEGSDTTVVEAPEAGDVKGIGDIDPVIVVSEPNITEILDGTQPTDGETTEPETESGLAGSGDAMASTGDSTVNDGGTIEDAGVPVAAVDTGDVTDELLELLDETSDEVV